MARNLFSEFGIGQTGQQQRRPRNLLAPQRQPTLSRPTVSRQAEQESARALAAQDIAQREGRPIGEEGFVGGAEELARGVARGVAVTLPTMAGEALQFFDPEGGSEAVSEFGKGLVESAEQRRLRNPFLQRTATGEAAREADAFSVRGAVGEAGEMLAPSLGPAATGAGIGAAIGGPPGAAIGAAAGFVASLPLYFGSEAQNTYEAVLPEQLKEAKRRGLEGEEADEFAHDEAVRAGVITGGIEAGGEAIADRVTFGLFRMMPRPLKQGMVRAATKGLRNPIDMAKDAIKVMGTEVATELGQSAAQAEVRERFGVGEGAQWDDVKGVIVPTIIMSALTFGGAETIGGLNRRQAGKILADPGANPERRQAVVDAVEKEIRGQDAELADAWRESANRQIQAGEPVVFDEDTYRQSLGVAPEADEAQVSEAVKNVYALPAPGPIFVDPRGGAGTAGQRDQARRERGGVIETGQAQQPPISGPVQQAGVLQRPALPAPGPILVDPRGGAGTAGQRDQARRERGGVIEAGQAQQPPISGPLQRAMQQAGVLQRPALPAPDTTLFVDQGGAAATRGQIDEARRERAGVIETGQAQQPRAGTPARRLEKRAANAIELAQTRLRREEGDVYADPRLKRGQFRDALQSMSDELIRGGGMGFAPREGAKRKDTTGDMFADFGPENLVRTPSLNPGWFQNFEVNGHKPSVKEVQNVVEKVLKGEKLGVRQAAIAAGMMDVHQGERIDPSNIDYVRGQLQEQRERMFGDRQPPVDDIGASLQEDVYDESWTAEQRILADTTDIAAEVAGPDAVEKFVERLAIQDSSNAEIVDALITEFNLGEQRGTTEPTGPEAEIQPARALEVGEAQQRIDEQVGARGDEPGAGAPEAALEAAANEAATSELSPQPEPTEAQKEAGNFKLGHASFNGLDVSIENPRGSERKGVDASGKPWSVTMAHHYGYLKGTVGRDKDHLDVFLGPDAQNADLPVFVVNQVNPGTRRFDEHKVLVGFPDLDSAREGYLGNYEQGWQGAGSIAQMSLEDFKAWSKDRAQTTKPIQENTNGVQRFVETERDDRGRDDGRPSTEAEATGRDIRSGVERDGRRQRQEEEAQPVPVERRVGGERRKDAERRKEVSEMTPEEMRKALLINDVSGIPNRRAMNEEIARRQSDGREIFYVSIDADGLKWINDNLGHLTGDAFLSALGEGFARQTEFAYHISGDEFWVLSDSAQEAQRIMDQATDLLDRAVVIYTAPDGTVTTKTGVGFSYGIATEQGVAEEGLAAHKEERTRTGQRQERGERPSGLVEKPAEGRKAEDTVAEKEPAVEPVQADLAGPPERSETLDELRGKLEQMNTKTLIGVAKGSKVPVRSPPRKQDLIDRLVLARDAANTLSQYSTFADASAAVERGDISQQQVFDWLSAVSSKNKVKGLSPINWELNLRGVTSWGADSGAFRFDAAAPAKERDRADIPTPPAPPSEGLAVPPLRPTPQATQTEPVAAAPPQGYPVGSTQFFKGDEVTITSEPREEFGGLFQEAVKADGTTVTLAAPEQRQADVERAQQERAQQQAEFRKLPKRAKNYGKSNKVFTDKAADDARAKLRAKLGQLSSGIDPEIMQAGITLAGYHIEAGARQFGNYAKAMVEDLGQAVVPHLRAWYEAIRYYPGFNNEGMTETSDMDTAIERFQLDIDAILETEQQGAPDSVIDPRRGEVRDREPTGIQEPGTQADVQNGQPAVRERAERPVPDIEPADRVAEGEGRLSESRTTVPGERSGAGLFQGDGRYRASRPPARPGQSSGLDHSGEVGISAIEQGKLGVEEPSDGSDAALERKRADQAKANGRPVKPNDLANIRETLPYLLPAQQDDVLKAERRMAGGKHGIMFTNGTGTGKTYSGLGIVARHIRHTGDKNVLIITPSQPKVSDWIADAKNLGITATRLSDKKDKGRSVSVTSYANFRDNMELHDRDWSMIVYDESHYLMEGKDDMGGMALAAHRAAANHRDGLYNKSRWRDPEYKALEYGRREAVDNAVAEALKKKQREQGPKAIETGLIESVDEIQLTEKEKADAKEAGNKAYREQNDKKFIAAHERAIEGAKEMEDDIGNTFAVFLSASPFTYHKSVHYAEGYLFDYPGADANIGAYNVPDGREAFLMSSFGYRMRTGKLTQPESGVDVSLLERDFHERLKAEGAVSGRQLELEHDYSREFVKFADDLGGQVNAGFNVLYGMTPEGEFMTEEVAAARGLPQFSMLPRLVRKQFSFVRVQQLMEAIKGRHLVERVKKHLELGRKVVIFHDFREYKGKHPFDLSGLTPPRMGNDAEQIAAAIQLQDEISQFESNYPEYRNLPLTNLKSIGDVIGEEFGDQARFLRGGVSNKAKDRAIKSFNDDASNTNIIVVQRRSGREGISLHDATGGGHPRVLIDMGLPFAPVDAIQTEGRVYRWGLQSNAIMEYPILGVDFERFAFANAIATRSRTAENLAMGNQARNLEEAFKLGYLNATDVTPSADQGIGGVSADRTAINVDPYDRAKTYYWQRGKVTSRRDQRKGIDYFSTPEPLGLKMVEWAQPRPGERGLEPSAGHGAIARFFPGNTDNVFVEPSSALGAEVSLLATGNFEPTTFENLSSGQRFNFVVMNPPFGSGGKTAMDHLAMAMDRTVDGGRIVALIPEGPAADKKFEALMYGKEGEEQKLKDAIKLGGKRGEERRRLRQIREFHLMGDISLPPVTFERAGTKVKTHVVIIDRYSNPLDVPYQRGKTDIDAEEINELFDRLQDYTVADRGNVEASAETAVEEGDTELSDFGMTVKPVELESGNKVWEVSGKTFDHKAILREQGGRWFGPKKVWSFRTDPTEKLRQALATPETAGEYRRSEANVLSESPPEGMNVSDAFDRATKIMQRIADRSDISDLPTLDVRATETDAFGPGFAAAERTRGAFYPRSNRLLLITENIENPKKLVETIRHELLGHYGLNLFEAGVKREILQRILDSRGRKHLAPIFNEVERDNASRRAQMSDLEVAEEVFAYVAENQPSRLREWLDKIMAMVAKPLRKIGMLSGVVTMPELRDMARSIAQGIKLGAPTRTRPSTDQAQFKRKSKPVSPYREQNAALREEHKTLWQRAKQGLVRQLSPGGLLPTEVFKAKIDRDSQFEVHEMDVKNLVAHLEDAIQKAHGKKPHQLSEEQIMAMHRYLGGEFLREVPEPIRIELTKMRQYIDGLSHEYAGILFEEAKALLEADNTAGAAVKADLLKTIASNVGSYIHRSYRAFDDPNWPKTVPEQVIDNAREYLSGRYEERATQIDQWAAKARDRGENDKADRHEERAARLRDPKRVEQTLNTILKEGTAFDSMESFVRESKLGAKDLSVLKKRKDIAPEIRALLGEYHDPRLNFAKSATKMSRLIWNQRFLDRVKEFGMGEFLFNEEDRPPEAWKKIAAPSTEAYAPLSGLYTYPEVEQSFRDALGQEQMADWYRTIVQINGMVKYGKTVLSPTTALRNWMSAFFFTAANAHFDLSHMATSVKAWHEYRTNRDRGKFFEYLRHLKSLGVVYDTPYAGEMMRLLEESKIEDSLAGGKGMRIKEMLGLATKFYQFGDDFWKIIGFENEKALLMKHKGLSEPEAEKLAAERIRNTYPTYSMTGRFINSLRRFPLAGTFVSFPAEIIRTTYNMLRYLKEDMKDPQMRPLARRRLAGLAFVGGFAYAMQSIGMAILGVTDEEEEAFRDLAAPWQRNSNIVPVGRDERGNLRFVDLSFLDPYNYWKRPINAIMRDQPYEEMVREIGRETFSPFFGQDIAAGAIIEALNNKKATGGRVFNPQASPLDQTADIVDHIRKTVQPGAVSLFERMMQAIQGKTSTSGKKYTIADESLAAFGWRVSTHDPKVALYYKSFEFKDMKRDASRIIGQVARDPNVVSDRELRKAFARSMVVRRRAYKEMGRIVASARAGGMTDSQLRLVLRQSGISKRDTESLMRGQIPQFRPTSGFLRGAVKKARVLFEEEVQRSIEERRTRVKELAEATR